jgi:hypothetical protein
VRSHPADFDADDDPDLLAFDPLARQGYLLRNEGDGTLGAPEPQTVVFNHSLFAAGDFDDAPGADLAAAKRELVEVFLNDGHGRFVRGGSAAIGPGPRCLDAAEANGDLVLNILDGLFVLNFLFLGGPPPPYPSPGEPCGADGASGLGCLEYEGCATDESN